MARRTPPESNGGRAGPITRRTDLTLSRRRRTALAIVCGVATVSCDRAIERLAERGIDRAPATTSLVVDSVLPVAEGLARFQSGLPRVSKLESAARSRDELVTNVIAALESEDSARLAQLHVSRAEYAFLYYPTSIYARKPYELPPDIAWLLSEQNSRKGRDRILRRLAGNPLGFRGYECGPAATEGDNRFWQLCQVEYTDPAEGVRVRKRLFGSIIERDGSYKILSYANDF